MASASASVLRESHCSSCLSGSCFKMSKQVSLTYNLGTFQTVAFMLDLRASGSGAWPVRAGSLFRIMLWSPWPSSLLIFKTRHFGCLSFKGRIQKSGSYCGVHSFHFLRESSIFGDSFPTVGYHAWGRVPGKAESLPLLPALIWLYYLCCGGTVHLVLRSFHFRGNYFRCSCKFFASTGGGDSESSFATILNPSSISSLTSLHIDHRKWEIMYFIMGRINLIIA